MSKQRSFTPEFKARVVLQVLTGIKTTAQVCRQHQLSEQLVSQWKKQLLVRASQAIADGRNGSGAEDRVAELERMIGHLTMELEAAKKASELLSLPGKGTRGDGAVCKWPGAQVKRVIKDANAV